LAGLFKGDFSCPRLGRPGTDLRREESGIDSISLNPDSFVAATRHVAQTEKRLADAAPKAA